MGARTHIAIDMGLLFRNVYESYGGLLMKAGRWAGCALGVALCAAAWAGPAGNPRVQLTVGGKTMARDVQPTDGYILFENLAVDVARTPLIQVDVSNHEGPWWVLVAPAGGSFSNVHGSAGAGRALIHLFGTMGWKGAVTMDVMVKLRENISATQFDLSGEADKDLVFENAKDASASRFGEREVSLQCFVEDGRRGKNGAANGLPSGRRVASADKELGEYYLLPYGGLNAIELATHAAAPLETHVIDVPNHPYTKIGILGASQGGDASFTIVLQYEDGTSSTNWFELDDWYQRSRQSNVPAIQSMDWAISTDGAVENVDHFNLYEFVLAGVDRSKNLDLIVLANDPHRWPDYEMRWGAVFAVNGVADVVRPISR